MTAVYVPPAAARTTVAVAQPAVETDQLSSVARQARPVADQPVAASIKPKVTVAMFDPAFSGATPEALTASPPPATGEQFTLASAPPESVPAPAMTGVAPQSEPAKPQVAQTSAVTRAKPVQVASLPTQPVTIPRTPAKPPLAEAPQTKVRAAAEKVFEKIFGKQEPPTQVALGYAPTDTNISVTPRLLPEFDAYTAVYDIKNATVHMPDGTKLEAHSGIGPMRDNPASAPMRMRGVTPPHIYDLRIREALFHGVRAIRMTPVGGTRAIFNRDGFLAHRYMLGPRGDSHGCVAIKNYDVFLKAFQRGEIKRLVVVASID